MGVLRAADRRRLRQLYGFRCGYCGIRETDAGAELTEDHYCPIAQHGTDDFDNIVYACHTCNEFKKDHWNPHGDERILHPLNDDLSIHLSLNEESVLIPLTITGAFHIQRLRLNRPGLLAYRRERVSVDSNNQRIEILEQDLTEIKQLLSEVLQRLPPGQE